MLLHKAAVRNRLVLAGTLTVIALVLFGACNWHPERGRDQPRGRAGACLVSPEAPAPYVPSVAPPRPAPVLPIGDVRVCDLGSGPRGGWKFSAAAHQRGEVTLRISRLTGG